MYCFNTGHIPALSELYIQREQILFSIVHPEANRRRQTSTRTALRLMEIFALPMS